MSKTEITPFGKTKPIRFPLSESKQKNNQRFEKKDEKSKKVNRILKEELDENENEIEERKTAKKTSIKGKLQKREKEIGTHKRFINKRNQSGKQLPRTSKGMNNQVNTKSSQLRTDIRARKFNTCTWTIQQERRMEELETKREKKCCTTYTSEKILGYLDGPGDDLDEKKEDSSWPSTKTIIDVAEGMKPLNKLTWSDYEKERIETIQKITKQDIDSNKHKSQWYVTCQIKIRKIKKRAMITKTKEKIETEDTIPIPKPKPHRERREEEGEEDGGREALTQTNETGGKT